MVRCGSVIAYCLQIFSEYGKSEFRNYLIFNKAFFHDISCHCNGPCQVTKRKNQNSYVMNVEYCAILIINNEVTLSFLSRCKKNALAGRVDNICQPGQNMYLNQRKSRDFFEKM